MSLFNFIKDQISILDVAQEYTQLKRAGSYWKGHCPIHSEKTASFTVTPEKGIFYCFGCSTGGDVISFISQMERCSQIESAQHLIDRYSLDVPQELLEKSNQSTADDNIKKKRHFATCKAAARWFHEQLPKKSNALAYLYRRGVDKDCLNKFEIGIFPGSLSNIKSFIQSMDREGITLKDLFAAQILFEGKKVTYSPFEDRIVFPIRDHLGRACGFGGRTFKKDDERVKYYNSKENPFFDKGSILFGFDSAKKAIQKKNAVFLVEGYTDCLAVYKSGIKNVVATLGTSCTAKHIKLLSNYTDRLFVLYDGDAAGQKATIRLMELCLDVNIELNVVGLPQGEDPASFLANGGSLPDLIRKSKDIFDYLLETEAQNFTSKTLNEKLRVAKKIIGIISEFADPIKRELLQQKLAKAFGLPMESVQKVLESATPTNKRSHSNEPEAKKTEISLNSQQPHRNVLSAISPLEKKLFCAMIDGVCEAVSVNDDFLVSCFPSALLGPIRMFQSHLSRNKDAHFSSVFCELSEEERNLVSRLLIECESTSEAQAKDILPRFYREYWKKAIVRKTTELKQAQGTNDSARIEIIMREISGIKNELSKRGLI